MLRPGNTTTCNTLYVNEQFPIEGYTDETLSHYLNKSEMWECGKWGTDVEIRAFATMLNTNVYVFC